VDTPLARALRTSRPRLLAVWGKNDPFFLPAGAEAFKRDIPDADIRFVDAGHFALETHVEEIASAISELRRLAERGAFRLRLVAMRYSQVRIEDGIEVVASDRLAGRLGMVRRS
jgi:hypothetical protein